MPFNGTVFTLPNGATNAAPGQIVQSAIWNAIHADLNTGLTEVMSQLVSLITFRNALCDNGDFAVWQRGAGGAAVISVLASQTQYTADRWYIVTNANQATTVSVATPISNNSLNACAIQRTAAQTGIGVYSFGYPLTADELARLRGNEVTLECLLKAGSNFSPLNGTVNIEFVVGTGSPVKFSSGSYTNATTIISTSINLFSGVVTAFSAASSVVVPTNATQGEVFFTWTPVGTAGANDILTIGDVQLEGNFSASIWTPTDYDRITFEEQLQNCKRFFRKTFNYSTAPAQNAGLIGAICVLSQAAVAVGAQWNLECEEMFQAPSVISYNPKGASATWVDITTAVSIAVSIDTTSASNSPKMIYVETAAVVSAAAHQVLIHLTADAGI